MRAPARTAEPEVRQFAAIGTNSTCTTASRTARCTTSGRLGSSRCDHVGAIMSACSVPATGLYCGHASLLSQPAGGWPRPSLSVVSDQAAPPSAERRPAGLKRAENSCFMRRWSRRRPKAAGTWFPCVTAKGPARGIPRRVPWTSGWGVFPAVGGRGQGLGPYRDGWQLRRLAAVRRSGLLTAREAGHEGTGWR